jgi:acyl carrier protein
MEAPMSIVERSHSAESLESWMRNWLVQELGLNESAIERTRPFLRYGMNSIQAMMLVGDLEHTLGTPLPPTLVWDHPTIELLAAHLADLIKTSRPTTTEADHGPSGGLNSAQAKAILAYLDDYSDEQVEELLRRIRQ